MKFEVFGKTLTAKIWNGEKLGRKVALDLETELIREDSHVPLPVVGGAYDGSDTVYFIRPKDLKRFCVTHQSSINEFYFHNAAFDTAVIEKHNDFSFEDYILKNKIFDTALMYRLIHIATAGISPRKYNLALCCKEVLDINLNKDGDIRLTFDQYLNQPIEQISPRHLKYLAEDAVATYDLAQKLTIKFNDLPTSNRLSHQIQLMGDIALDRIRKRGIQIDLEYTNTLRQQLTDKLDLNADILATYGLVRGEKGFQKKYESIVNMLGLKLPRTGKSNKISMKAEHLEAYEHEHFVSALLEYLELEKLKAFLKELTKERVHPRYDSLKNTLRTGSSKPNIQNPPRVGGIREAFVPKPGHVFLDIDYSSIELYALAHILKTLFKHSTLYDKLKENKDIHIYAASEIWRKPEDDVISKERQIAKICNYGLAANMGVTTFQKHMQKQGVELTFEETKKIKDAWSTAFPEIRKFWKRGTNRSTFVSKTGFVRAHCSYTQYLNTHFQSLVAEGCKIMLYFLEKEGFKTVAFIHDQVLVEHPEENAEQALVKVQDIMKDAMQKIIPSLTIHTDGKITKRFCK